MTDNPYENLYNKNNEELQNPEAQNIGTTPVDTPTPQPQYSFDYSQQTQAQPETASDSSEVFSESSADDNTQPEEHPCSYEWYGDKVIDNTPVYQPPYNAPVVEQKTKKQNRRMPVAVILILCILLSSIFGAGSAFLVNTFSKDSVNTVTTDKLTINQISPDYEYDKDGNSAGMATVDIVETAADSVVEIITESVKTGSFAQQYIESGAGSGVIVDSSGYIVTNSHVIEGAEKITVTLRSGDSYTATLVGSDSQEDLALLKIDAENLTAAVFGNSDNLRVGERTVAIGNPLGQLGGSVTEGIISALDRDVLVDGQTMNLLQTDTAINPGNSGGGLFDSYGNLIGVVVAKSSGSEVEGLGFAIPVNDVVDVISDLKEYGYVRGRIDIGMEFIDVNNTQVAWMYGLSETGCYVYSVDSLSNAESAGFKSGDLILKVDGKEVSTSDDIESVLEGKAVGEKVVFTLKRGEATGDITLTLQEYVPTVNSSSDDNDYFQWYDFGY